MSRNFVMLLPFSLTACYNTIWPKSDTGALLDEDTAVLSDTEDTTDPTDSGDTSEPSDSGDTSDTGSDGMSMVRVAYLSPDTPLVDVCVNGAKFGVDSIGFAGVSDDQEVPAGQHTFSVTESGEGCSAAYPASLVTEFQGDMSYTVIAHGFLSEIVFSSNEFELTAFSNDRSPAAVDSYKVQVIHAAAVDSFAQVDIWNTTDSANPVELIPDLDYGADVTIELPLNAALELGIDIDNDGTPDSSFDLPDDLSGFVGLYAVNDASGQPFLMVHKESGETHQIFANPVQ